MHVIGKAPLVCPFGYLICILAERPYCLRAALGEVPCLQCDSGASHPRQAPREAGS